MTVANQTSRTYAPGSAAAGQEIPFSFPITASSELTVKTRVTATGVEATLTEPPHYTVSINGDSGGTVTLVSALAATSQVWIVRDTPKTQSLNLEQGGAFSAENLEDAFDKNCRLVVDNADSRTRSLRAPDTDPSALDMTLPNSIDRASGFLKFDTDGVPTAVTSQIEDTYDVSAYMVNVIDDASEAIFKATVNLEIGTDVQAWDTHLDAIAALTATDSNVIVGNGTTWVAESGATARTSLGAATAADVPKTDEILTYEGDVLTYEGNVLTYEE